MQDLYTENYRTLLKEIKLYKWRAVLCSRIGRSSIVKMAIVPKVIDRFNLISIKSLTAYFAEMGKLILKFI